MGDRIRRYFYSLISDRQEGFAARIIKIFLSLFSLIYLCAIVVVQLLYRIRILKSYRPPCKVISVGNITLGGTGKTPLVLTIARRLKGSGKRLAILIRGYKANAMLGKSDEVELFKKHLSDIPILVGRDRIKTAKEAVDSYGADIILLDDGFQHWRLNRDLDIVTLDIRNPFGNEKLIPRGILREPLSSLKKAEIFVLTKVGYDGDSIAKSQGLKNRLNTINKDALVFTSSYVPTMLYNVIEENPVSTTEINGKEIALLCGIADPESFEDSVRSLGAKVVLRYFFLDHHKYDESELKAITNECKSKGVNTVVTTEKDVPRLVDKIRNMEMKFLALGIELKIDDEEKFFDRLYSIFSR